MEDQLSLEGLHGDNGDSGVTLSPIVLLMLPKKKNLKKKKKKKKKRGKKGKLDCTREEEHTKKKSVKSVYMSMYVYKTRRSVEELSCLGRTVQLQSDGGQCLFA